MKEATSVQTIQIPNQNYFNQWNGLDPQPT